MLSVGVDPFLTLLSHDLGAGEIVLFIIIGVVALALIALLLFWLLRRNKKKASIVETKPLEEEKPVEAAPQEKEEVEEASAEEIKETPAEEAKEEAPSKVEEEKEPEPAIEEMVEEDDQSEMEILEDTVNADGDEILLEKDKKGNIFEIRFIKSFTAKLIQAPEETKKYYEELKNEILSYKKTNSRVSWNYDSVNAGRNQVLKFAIRGKTLCVYYPLNADDYADTKYKVEVAKAKKYEDVPCLFRIKNDRRLGYAKDLMAEVAKKLELEKGEEKNESYVLPYEENKPLLKRGLIKEVKVKVSETALEGVAEPKEEDLEVLEKKVNADGDEILLEKDKKGNIFEIRFIKSFTAKLSQSEDIVKDYYTILKNYALSYKKVNSRVSWHYDSLNLGRNQVLKFAIRGKTLCVYYALKVEDYADTKYKVEAAKAKKYEDVPCLFRIKNDRRLGYAKDLIDDVMKKFEAEKGKEENEDYRIPTETTKALLKKGLIKEVMKRVKEEHIDEHHKPINVEEADKMMTDEVAEAAIEEDVIHHHHKGKKEIINIDTLSQNFLDGDVVDLNALIKKKLVPAKTGYVKVLARGTLDKRLIVDLDDFSLQAVKMIVLLGGHAKKIQ